MLKLIAWAVRQAMLIKNLATTGRMRPDPWQFPMISRQAGMVVNQGTALQAAAVWSSVRIISETLAALPWEVLLRDGARRERQQSHPTDRLLTRQPNPEMTPFDMKQMLAASVVLWGNGYAEIERAVNGQPLALWPIAPDRVTVTRDDAGDIVYNVRGVNGSETVPVPAENMFHVKGLGFDGLVGFSVVHMAARSIGINLATDQFSASFFANGLFPGVAFEHPEKLSGPAHENLKQSYEERFQGPKKANTPLIAEEGMKVKSIGMPLEEAQFIESRKFQVGEIARWFRIPPHKIGAMEGAKFNNIQQQAIEFLAETMLPWLIRFEQEANIKLFGRQQRGRLVTKFNLRALLRGDDKARADFYEKMWKMGVFSINEIRELEDQNPIGPEGNKRFVQLNLTTLERAGEPRPAPEPAAPAADEPDPVPNEDDPEADEAVASAHRAFFASVLDRIRSREQHRLGEAMRNHPDDPIGFAAWLTGFMEQHQAYVEESLAPAVGAVAESMGAGPGVDNVTRFVAVTYVQDAQAALETLYAGEQPETRIEAEHLRIAAASALAIGG